MGGVIRRRGHLVPRNDASFRAPERRAVEGARPSKVRACRTPVDPDHDNIKASSSGQTPLAV